MLRGQVTDCEMARQQEDLVGEKPPWLSSVWKPVWNKRAFMAPGDAWEETQRQDSLYPTYESMASSFWQISFNMMLPRSIHTIANSKTLSFLTLNNFLLCICTTFLYPIICEHLGCFYILATVYSGVMNIEMQTSFWHCVFCALGVYFQK